MMNQQQPSTDPFYGRSEDFVEFVRDTLSQNLHYKLNEKISDKNAMKIADAMTDWETKLALPLDLTMPEIADLNSEQRPQIRRRNVLKKWKDKKKHKATYGNLLECCLEGDDNQTAEKICEVLTKEGSGSSSGSRPLQQGGGFNQPPAPQGYQQQMYGASAPYGQASLPAHYHQQQQAALGATGSAPQSYHHQPTGKSTVDSDSGSAVGTMNQAAPSSTAPPKSLRIVLADGGSESSPTEEPDKLSVLRELMDVTHKLRTLALVLEIPFKDIETDFPNSVATRREKMVERWFQGASRPSWSKLCAALRDPLVERHDIANTIESKHPSAKQ